MCSPDPKSSGKYLCTVPAVSSGENVGPSSSLCKGQIEAIVPPTIRSNKKDNDTLYPFTCKLCNERFNAQKALDVHSHTCPKQASMKIKLCLLSHCMKCKQLPTASSF